MPFHPTRRPPASRRLPGLRPLAVLLAGLILGPGLSLAACDAAGEPGEAAGDPADRVDPDRAGLPASAPSPDDPGDAASDRPDPSGVESARTPTSDWADRRVLAEADAHFPHSAHRDLDCRRCHARPRGHVTHTGAACTGCHAPPPAVAGAPTLPAGECAACHHQRATAGDCVRCHTAAPEPRPALASVATAGGERVRVVRLTFDHARHGGLACTRCHADQVTRDFPGDCSACHADHHRPEAACTACHDAGRVATHGNDVHAGCAGAACHDAATVRPLAATRNVCLACHLDRVDHEKGEECSSCHVGLLTAPGAPARSSAGSPAGGRR